MRRTISLAAAAAAVLVAAVPASAAVRDDPLVGKPAGGGGWIPAPSAPFDLAAGVTCDFPIHGEAVVDKVVRMVLQRYPDGSVKQEMITGALVARITNTATGRSIERDTSGTGVWDYKPGGTASTNFTSHGAGPFLLGMRENGGNLPRGLYVVNGVYTLTVSETGFRTVEWKIDGGAENICDAL